MKRMASSFSIIRKETSQLFYSFTSDCKLKAPITFLWKQINNIKFLYWENVLISTIVDLEEMHALQL